MKVAGQSSEEIMLAFTARKTQLFITILDQSWCQTLGLWRDQVWIISDMPTQEMLLQGCWDRWWAYYLPCLARTYLFLGVLTWLKTQRSFRGETFLNKIKWKKWVGYLEDVLICWKYFLYQGWAFVCWSVHASACLSQLCAAPNFKIKQLIQRNFTKGLYQQSFGPWIDEDCHLFRGLFHTLFQ